MERLVLFDIDNTLLKSTLAHQYSFVKALEEVFEIPFTLEDIKTGNKPGTTDPEILISALRRKKVPEEEVKKKLPLCFEKVVQIFPSLLEKEGLVVLPGVKDLLPALREENSILGLVTGNLEPIAWFKLEKVEIKPFFSLGAFGSDHPERSVLVSLAIERAKRHFSEVPLERVYLVGDTVRDVMAGKKAGVKTIAVATGNVDKQTLINSGADLVLDTLAEIDKIMTWIKRN